MIRRLCRGMLVLAIAIGSLGPVSVYGSDMDVSVASYSPLHLKATGGVPAGSMGALASSVLDAVALPGSPVAASLPTQGSSRLYSVDLAAGDRLSLALTAPSGEFDVYVYAPGLGLLSGATAIAHASEGRYPRALSYDVPRDISGKYYIEVYAYDGFGSYGLDWSVTPGTGLARK
ncbi:MAG: PPC domain-containing protein, partial [Actinomycetota bacterium]|nr:PPC domain-containing protein [Actinomycetota bacterium]